VAIGDTTGATPQPESRQRRQAAEDFDEVCMFPHGQSASKCATPLSRPRLVAIALALVITTGTTASAKEPVADVDKRFREDVKRFIDAHCVACHGPDKPKGELDLTKFTTDAEIAAGLPHAAEVLDQLKSERMPPKKARSQPTTDERKAAITLIESLRAHEARRNAGDPGIVLARRLSNTEYDYTIRDLTGVDIRPAREFPVDPANGSGFDNTGESLTMSPALVTKYLAAARQVADHLLLLPEGFTFAPYPVLTDTDRDKFCVRRIVDFYQRQPTDLADYFQAAWRYRYRATLGNAKATLADCASATKVSPKYLEVVWGLLNEAEAAGPIAAVHKLWNALPEPISPTQNLARRDCEKLRDFVVKLRGQVQVKVENLTVPGMNPGAQALVLRKDRAMAAGRRKYGGGGLQLKLDDLGVGADVKQALTPPTDEADQKKFESAFERFCSVFPDAFVVSERGRVFLDPKVDATNTGRLLSAGFHNQMGYFRDDGPLSELILDEAGRHELDKLWERFEFACNLPNRMHSGLIWFERSESRFLAGTEFDFARAEDKDVVSPTKFKRFADEYMKKTKRSTSNEVIVDAVREHFERSETNIRRVERTRESAEPSHVRGLQEFAERAYRHRLAATERDSVAAFYRTLRADGLSHEDAVRDTVASILMSPKFCFRVDLPMTAGKENKTTDPLASRLSYFLWSSMPDRELMEVAAQGKLHQPEVVLAQARRMLKDDRIRGLAIQFGGNWLDFRRFDEHNAVDRGRYPQFDNDLRQAMYEEPVRFLVDLFQRDRSVLDCLDGRHTFVNAALAKHYGMPFAGRSDEWVRIDDATQYSRGGILPMAAFMTKNAPGLRTSPVKRGYWVVTRLLGERIPAPPPDVPELPADEKKLGSLSLRETLAKHRENVNCAGCHARFDSFGLAFEGFGPIGECRTKDLAGHAVDTHVMFPGNTEGDGVAGLRDYLRTQRRDDFLDNLCRKLLAYALGRGLILSDEPTITAMRTRLAHDENRFSSLIESIVTSPQFLNRRGSGGLKKDGTQ
jgi:mono/diheme cytochrome c family protein